VSPSGLTVRRANEGDVDSVARLFGVCFPDSVSELFPDGLPRWPLAELLGVLLRAEPGCCHVAEDDRGIVGYCFSPSDMSRIWIRVLRSAGLRRVVWGIVRGEVPLHPRRVLALLRDKASFILSFRSFELRRTGQILSLGVSPEARGRGVGKMLLQRAIEYLDSSGAYRVKLEVRPDNLPALRLYEGFGFYPVQCTRDSRGGWVVMTLPLGDDESCSECD